MPTLDHSYDPLLVATSVAIAVWASYVALSLTGNVARSAGRVRAAWVGGGSLAMGIGIWSMHFTGMLAFHLDTPVGYQVGLVIVSMVVAIAASALALAVASRSTLGGGTLGVAGLAMGAAIAGMHYIGMAAMHMAAAIQYRASLVLLSVLIAIVASVAALWLAFRFRLDDSERGWWRKRAAASTMGVAIAGMHYTGMAAARFVPAESTIAPGDVLVTTQLTTVVIVGTFLVLGIAQAGSRVVRDLRLRAADEAAVLRTAEAVREREQYYRALIERGSDVILVTDARGVVRYQSPSAERVLGRAPGELVGRSGLERIHPDDRAAMEQSLRDVVARPGQERRARCRVQHGNGSWRTLDVAAINLLNDPSVRGVVVNCRDITEAIQVEEQLRQSQKLEAVGQLTAGIVHDFNNALSAILANAQLVAAGLPTGADTARSGLEDIEDAAQAGAAMVRKLLAFSREASLDIVPTDLGSVVPDLVTMLQRILPATVEFELPAKRLPTWAHVDPGAVQQIVLNLATNARDAMPHGGRLQILCTSVTVDPTSATRHGVAADRYVRLEVRDTGVGMDETTLARIFEPFFTTKAPGKGTGLGMAMIQTLVRQQGGFVEVESELGVGTAVAVHFRAAEPVSPAAGPGAGEVSGGTETILLVEDQEVLRRTGKRILEHLGYRVQVAANGREALELLTDGASDVDLVVSDVDMPEVDGLTLYQEVRKRGLSVKFMLASGYSADEALGPGDGARPAFVQKPWTLEDMARAVRRALGKGA